MRGTVPPVLFVALLVALPVGACTPLGGTPSPAASAIPSGGEAGTVECPDRPMLSPRGERINLTGTWEEREGSTLYYIYQSGECVWWAAGFATSATAPDLRHGGLGLLTEVFAGRLDPDDFMLRGSVAIVRSAEPTMVSESWASLAVELVFETVDGTETIVLHAPTTDDELGRNLVKISDQAIPPP